MKWAAWAIIALLVVILVSGCTQKISADLPASTTAKEIVPDNIAGYSSVNTNELVSTATSMTIGSFAGAASENPAIAYKSAQITDQLIQCYQEAGATDSSGFYNTTFPLYGGVVAVVDENQIRDPNLFFKCITRAATSYSIEKRPFQPCLSKFTIETHYNRFHVIIVGTDVTVCQSICQEMPACPTT